MPLPGKNKPKTIGIVGTRRRTHIVDWIKCLEAFEKEYKKGDRIVSGGCKEGGDNFAEDFARMRGISITIHYPRREDLDRELEKVNARAAWAKVNYARNTLVAQDADVLIAVVAPDRKGGTEDTIKKAEKLGKKVVLVL